MNLPHDPPHAAENGDAGLFDLSNPAFYASPADLESLADMPRAPVEPALKRLGPPPFARKGFPIMGLFATIYDHVAERVRGD